MTIIDQRILIPAAPDIVWACVSDIDSNTTWQTECEAVSHLSSRRSGPGVRWRSTSPDRREQVMEITAWYDGLGYEYTVVDGLPFASAKGRIRLQEIPEGTIVQWTFTYEPKGVAGSLRSSLGTRRRIENAMVESLKNLWRHINHSGGTQRSHEAKSLMRDALDYEARANYKPRHPSAVEEHGAEQSKPEFVIPEPPIADDDTRPRPAVQRDTAAEPMTVPDDAEAIEAVVTEAPPAAVGTVLEQELAARFAEPKPLESIPAPELIEMPADIEQSSPVEADAVAEAEVESEAEIEVTVESEPVPLVEEEESEPPVSPLPAPPTDTTHVSIWEIFGVPAPSEAQPVSAVEAEAVSAAPSPAAPVPEPAVAPVSAEPAAPPTSAAPELNLVALLGWRAAQRRTQAKVRHR